ncbi:MAG: outer membrane protein assembly factor BamB [Planctomycetota bacterium]|jgi:outer membrane protein assembly factor BamB
MFAPARRELVVAKLAVAVGLMLTGSISAQGNSWRDFRGPSRNGFVANADVPLTWSEQENVTWKFKVVGSGWSSPVVDDGKVWLTTATDKGEKLHVVAVDVATGKLLHEQVVFESDKPEKKNALNSYASPSPVIEPGRVYVHFGTYGTACFDTKSFEQVWQRRDLNCDHMEGPGSSPILFEDLLIFNVDGGDVQYVVALDKATGETKWRTDRSIDLTGFPPDLRKAYSTPIVMEVAGKPQLVSSGAQGSYAYDPRTGKELWHVRFKGFSMASRPIAGDGMVFVTTGFMRARMLSVKVPAVGDVTDTNVAWTYSRNVPKMASPILAGNRVFMVDDGGFATCLDHQTGKALWRKRVGGEHCSSPLCIGDRIYFFDREGKTVVIEKGDVYKELASNQLDAGFMATPAVVGNAFVMRTRTHVYRIEAGK